MTYQHFKGGKYTFIGIAYVEKTLEPVVVYESCENGGWWTRPAEEFFGTVVTRSSGGDCTVSRFTPLNPLLEAP